MRFDPHAAGLLRYRKRPAGPRSSMNVDPSTTLPATAPTAPSGTIWLVRVCAVLAVLSILWQGFSASNVIIAGDAALGPHEAGAIVVHVLTGLLALASAAQWWATRPATWPTVLSVV